MKLFVLRITTVKPSKQVQETQEKMTAMQKEYRKQIDNLEVNLSTTNGTLLRRDNEIKMLREGVSYISNSSQISNYLTRFQVVGGRTRNYEKVIPFS